MTVRCSNELHSINSSILHIFIHTVLLTECHPTTIAVNTNGVGYWRSSELLWPIAADEGPSRSLRNGQSRAIGTVVVAHATEK